MYSNLHCILGQAPQAWDSDSSRRPTPPGRGVEFPDSSPQLLRFLHESSSDSPCKYYAVACENDGWFSPIGGHPWAYVDYPHAQLPTESPALDFPIHMLHEQKHPIQVSLRSDISRSASYPDDASIASTDTSMDDEDDDDDSDIDCYSDDGDFSAYTSDDDRIVARRHYRETSWSASGLIQSETPSPLGEPEQATPTISNQSNTETTNTILEAGTVGGNNEIVESTTDNARQYSVLVSTILKALLADMRTTHDGQPFSEINMGNSREYDALLSTISRSLQSRRFIDRTDQQGSGERTDTDGNTASQNVTSNASPASANAGRSSQLTLKRPRSSSRGGSDDSGGGGGGGKRRNKEDARPCNRRVIKVYACPYIRRYPDSNHPQRCTEGLELARVKEHIKRYHANSAEDNTQSWIDLCRRKARSWLDIYSSRFGGEAPAPDEAAQFVNFQPTNELKNSLINFIEPAIDPLIALYLMSPGYKELVARRQVNDVQSLVPRELMSESIVDLLLSAVEEVLTHPGPQSIDISQSDTPSTASPYPAQFCGEIHGAEPLTPFSTQASFTRGTEVTLKHLDVSNDPIIHTDPNIPAACVHQPDTPFEYSPLTPSTPDMLAISGLLKDLGPSVGQIEDLIWGGALK